MRKAVAFLTASLGLAWVVAANAQTAPDTFKDVPSDHWAYQAVDALRAKGILVGYPDGLYRGKRTMTRYEFAVALKRALDSIGTIKGEKGDPGAPGAPGATGPQGPQGEKGDSGVSPDDLAALKKLADEFKAELAKVGVDVNAANARIDKLAKDVAALKAAVAGLPKITGAAFMGIRSDRAAGSYIDQNGSVGTPMSHSLVDEALVMHSLKLGVQAKLGDVATLTSSLVFGNYTGPSEILSGNVLSPLSTNPKSYNYIDQLEISAPFTGMGSGGSMTFGRFGYAISPLTLCRPNVDVYFENPIVDDNQFRLDGFKVSTNLGSLGATVFGGKTDTLQGFDGEPIMMPAIPIGGGIFKNGKPTAMVGDDYLLLSQLGGLTFTLPTTRVAAGGKLSFTALAGTGYSDVSATNIIVLGADAGIPLSGKTSLTASWSKGIAGVDRFKSASTGENNAFDGAVSTSLGAMSARVGYRYIDPQFAAPGYWGRIGNWINPTNIQGPNLKLGYDLSPSLGLTASVDMLKAARNRPTYSFGKDDALNHVAAGLKWDLSPAFSLTGDYEGAFYKIVGPHAGASTSFTGTCHPTEEYVTLGTGYKVNGATLLKLGYQIGTVEFKSLMPGGGYTYNTFFSQVAVKF